MQPLSDLLVLDFSTLLPGPLASLFLAEAGARVIRIERPDGEDMRRFPPRFGETSAPFAALNRGKQSLAIDLKAPDALERLTPLIVQADIVIEQFRPGVMARLGFGYEALKALNPRLVYCSISGYGQDGPRAFEAGHDINYQAIGGLLGQSLAQGRPAPLPPTLVADIASLSKPGAGSAGSVGVAAWRLDGKGPAALVNADVAYPMASTFKVAVAASIQKNVEHGRLKLDQIS
eukprot:gene12490-15890_t